MTATAPAPLARSIPQEQAHSHIVLHGVSWELYERLLAEVGDQHVRMTYDEGALELMSPLPRHERLKPSMPLCVCPRYGAMTAGRWSR